jgi:hypothetical protein
MAILLTTIPNVALASPAKAYEKAKRRLNDGIDVSLETGKRLHLRAGLHKDAVMELRVLAMTDLTSSRMVPT